MIQTPLADAIRPRTMDEIVGQEHLFGKSGVLRRMIGAGRLTNMIFYGPPGTGKTTAASVIAAASGMAFHKLNATTASLADVKAILAETGGMFGASGILLYLDEIQYFNRKQQQSLLEYMEDGRITLIASTTENPHFYVYNALISRSSLFEFKPVAPRACLPVLHRALDWLNTQNATSTTLPDDVGLLLAGGVEGDVRRAVGLLENAYFAAGLEPDAVITREHVAAFDAGIGNFSDDVHYDLLGCLQKSIRGSDPDATAFYVAKMLALGEMFSLCRRLQVIASEDIGLAYPQAIAITKACVDSGSAGFAGRNECSSCSRTCRNAGGADSADTRRPAAGDRAEIQFRVYGTARRLGGRDRRAGRAHSRPSAKPAVQGLQIPARL